MDSSLKTGTVRSFLSGTRLLLRAMEDCGITVLPLAARKEVTVGTKADRLKPIRQKALRCRACRLSTTRHSVVFGEGSLDAKIVFVGEGPGQEEDAQGRPFVGAAGKLLDKMIQAMGFTREELYIANVVKCRPPMNRPPLPDEIASCSGYLEAQLTTVAPRVICALGKTAAATLLKTVSPMSQLRGRPHRWRGIPVVVTFHPAYLLRNPAAKTMVWEDLQRDMNGTYRFTDVFVRRDGRWQCVASQASRLEP